MIFINLETMPPPPNGLKNCFCTGERKEEALLPIMSFVIPCFNEEDGVTQFYEALAKECLRHPELEYEYVFVNDGSTDNTQIELLNLANEDSRIVVVELSRNFGKESALSAGLKESRGDVVVPIDSDLQHPPGVVFQLWNRFCQKDVDVVIAKRRSRRGESFLYRWATKEFYKIEDLMSECPIPRDAGDFRLMSRRVVDALCALPEKRRFMKGLYAWIGFKVAFIEYEVAPRLSGKSKFSLPKLISLALNGILDFSTFPLKLWTYIGFFISLLAFVSAVWIVLSTLFLGNSVPGYASLITAIVFFGGVQLLSIGILGEYIGRLYGEVKGRPAYVIRQVYRREATWENVQ